jgi:transposase
MTRHYFVGIDIAKETLDWAVYTAEGICLSTHGNNTSKAIRATLTQLKALPNWQPEQVVFCMEHTGIYNAHVLEVLHQQGLPIWLESALQIKQTGGIQRGKTDKVDAQRIAQYAYRYQDRLKLWQPPRQVVQQLALLSSTRQRLNQAYNLLNVPLTEQELFITANVQKQLKASVRQSLTTLKAQQKVVEQQIQALIQGDARLKELFDLMVSVPGIGPVIATELLVVTNEMQTMQDPKKLACHAGVAPFEHRSGTSIRGTSRVSHLARKRLKALIHLGVRSALLVPGDFQTYYQRKLAEGKPEMVVVNAVRNKLIHRVCAVVRRGKKYDKNYTPALA